MGVGREVLEIKFWSILIRRGREDFRRLLRSVCEVGEIFKCVGSEVR